MFYGDKFKHARQHSQRIVRAAQNAIQGTTGSTTATAPPPAYVSARHADGGNIEVALYDVDPYDNAHFIYDTVIT